MNKNQTVELFEEDEDQVGSPSDDYLFPKSDEAVLYSSDWTIETIVNQMKRESILLNPQFQRRDAWSIPKKSAFIESILLNLPIPQIVLAESKGKKGEFLVLDGKQRLLTLLQFFGLSKSKNNSFRLSRLDFLKNLNGAQYNDLELPINVNYLNQLLSFTIRSVVIRNWPTNDYLDLIFVRLNQNSVRLSPQELRQALFPGPFLDQLDKFSYESERLQALLGNGPDADFRMRDIELVLRSISFQLFLPDYRGNLKHFLDDTCQYFNDNWDAVYLGSLLNTFDEKLQVLESTFGFNGIARKWNGMFYESRLNRAILDIHLYYLEFPQVRQAYLYNAEAIVNGLKNLCGDPAFLASIESSTKNMKMVEKRFSVWGLFLKELGLKDIPIPTIDANNRFILS